MAVNRWAWVCLGLLCWAVAASALALHYYNAYRTYEALYTTTLAELGRLTVEVNILIDYGNGTRVWYNNTLVPLGSTLFNATLMVAVVNYTFYKWPGQGYPNDMAVFVLAINGVWNDPGKQMAWLWWYWDPSEGKWVLGPVGCNHPNATVVDGGIYAWVYESYASWPPPPP